MELRSALVYGHSQAQPSGMGDDMVAALKKRKVKVKRVGLQGRNDGGLLREYDKQGLGDPSQYDAVFLYGYGNDSTREQTKKLVAFLGPERTVLIIPPINLDRVVKGMTTEERLERQKQRVRELPEELGIPVYGIWGYAKDFKSDDVHMLPGSQVSKDLVEQILSDLESGRQGVSPLLIVGGMVAAAAVLALAARKRR